MDSLIIRAIEEADLKEIREIHNKFYKDEFNEIDFRKHFLCAFVIEENDKIITAGGIRTILEAVAITDKNLSAGIRYQALMKMLQADLHFADNYDYQELHAFIQDESWKNQLIRKGFRYTKGDALVIGI